MTQIHDKTKASLERAAKDMKKFYDRKHKPEEFNEGDLVWLDMKDINAGRPKKKLDVKREGPFKITRNYPTSLIALTSLLLGKSITPFTFLNFDEPSQTNSTVNSPKSLFTSEATIGIPSLSQTPNSLMDVSNSSSHGNFLKARHTIFGNSNHECKTTLPILLPTSIVLNRMLPAVFL